jgi:integrator complex subunit 11
MFEFTHITQFDMSFATADYPMILLASPGMLHAGVSLAIFRMWAPHEKNCVILPG